MRSFAWAVACWAPLAMPAATQAFTVRSKMRRNRSATQRCRISSATEHTLVTPAYETKTKAVPARMPPAPCGNAGSRFAISIRLTTDASASRVLRPAGELLSGFVNPLYFLFDDEAPAVVYEPETRLEQLRQEHSKLTEVLGRPPTTRELWDWLDERDLL